jgi:uncharacterized protein
MLKWFLIFAIAWIIYRYLTRPPARSQQPESAEKMLECAECGVRFPESEAVRADDRVFCSEAHRQEHQSR